MVSDLWTTIGEIAEVFDGPHATPKKIDYGPFFLSISSLREGKLDLSQSAHLSEEEFVKWTRRVTPAAGDVLFSYETRLGEAALMPPNVTACLGRRMGLLRPKKEKVSPRYLLYAYLSPPFQSEIKVRTINGCTVDRLPLKDLPSFPIRIPPLPEQKAIAHMLGTLDDRIELNRRMNETLEAMAQALFKSWFVDFDPVIDNALASGKEIPPEFSERAAVRAALGDKRQPLPAEIRTLFPDEFTDSAELGWIPKGWDKQVLYDMATFINGAAFKSSLFSTEPDALPIIKIAEIKNGISEQTKFTKENVIEKCRVNDGDILFSWSGNPDTSIDTFIWSGGSGWLNQHIFRVSLKEKQDHNFVYYQLKMLRPVFAEIARDKQTTGLGHVTVKDMKHLYVLKPKEAILREFNSYSDPLFNKWYKNILATKELTLLRDTLLPKLLSGEVRIPDAEKMVEELV